MARATTKGDLITSANGQFDKMWKLIDSMSEERQKAAFADEMATAGKETHWSRDRNLRDVLVYLYEWHQLLLRWIKAKLDGGLQNRPARTVQLEHIPGNERGVWKKHQSTPLTQAKANLKESHKEVMTLIGQFSNDELFVKGAFDWPGTSTSTSTLGAYCVSTTASHYDWAMRKIRMHIKTSNK